MTPSEFHTPGGYGMPRDAEAFSIISDEPVWFVPNPAVKGFKLLAFFIARRLCQNPRTWAEHGWWSCFYRCNGAPRLKPYQAYWLWRQIHYSGDVPVLLPPLND